ncbi:MAG: VIT and VWA domain-containing protein [Phycisphaerae bacterium]|jgi:Ca-activated chloride channel family protein|nr:VIT and VWA domain-containing protein [Phycisphaerae bacterium]
MKKTYAILIAAMLTMVLLPLEFAQADGMIVPIRRDIRVRGSWAVKYHHVNVLVRDQVAAVSVDQAFVNTGRGMIEVEYLFPVPPKAAIDSMTLVVDGKEFTAKLLKADEARKIYEDIVRKKKDPALLEYVGFGLYKTRAFPLMPGKPCKVIVTYKTVCKKDQNLVEVWYPLNTEKYSARAIESVRVNVDIKSKADIGPVYSPTHSLNVKRKAPDHVVATYEVKKALPTTDFQLFYKSANEKIGASLVTHQTDPKSDGHFMMLVSPNPRNASTAVVAKNVIAVFDHSGSMSDKKIAQAKDALRFILKNLNSEDKFNVVAYNDSVETFFGKTVGANKEKITVALDMVDRLEATGGTNIHEALQVALKQIDKSKRPSYVIFLTDGQPTVGKTEEKDILYDTKTANKCGARIFTFGVGYQPNVRLLDKLAMDNNGRSDYVKPKEPIETKVSSLYNKIKNPVMTDLKIKLQGVKLKDMYPRKLGDLFDGDQIVVVGRYQCQGASRKSTLVVNGVYQGKQRGFEYNVTIRPPGKDMRYVFVEKIWATRRVGYLMDQIQLSGKSKEVIDELIRLSKKYGIMTPYTSFLADETTRLHRPSEVRLKAAANMSGLAESSDGFAGQNAAKMRRSLNDSTVVAPTSPVIVGRDGRPGKGGGVRQYGNSTRAKYEGKETEYVTGLRNVGNTSLYRRGRVWIASSASQLDPAKDADKIKKVKRFSDKYFELIRRNSVAENQVMASQQDDEEMLIVLRGQAYQIE